IDQPGLRQSPLPVTDPPIAFEPAETLFLLDRTLEPVLTILASMILRGPSPTPLIQHPKAEPLWGHSERRMDVQAQSRFVAQRAQTLDLRLAREIQLRRILVETDHRKIL